MRIQRPKGKLIAVDLDGTLCTKGFPDVSPLPIHEAILRITELHQMGANIIIYTEREDKWYPETRSWLIKCRVPFEGIAMQHRPRADYYIDDKSINTADWMAEKTRFRTNVDNIAKLTPGVLLC